MRRESQPQRDLVTPGRFTGIAILAMTLALGLFAFLVVGPMVESNSHLDAIEDVDDRERLERGLRTLCNTTPNIDLLNKKLAGKSREDRNKVTPIAKSLGCLSKLDARFQAEHHLWMGDEQDAVDSAVAAGEAAIEPAIDALEAPDSNIRGRAYRALGALSSRLLTDHKTRIQKHMDATDRSPAAMALRTTLGLAIPSDDPVKVVEDTPEASPDMGGAPGDMGQDAADMSQDMSADMEGAGEDEINLGTGGFRLKLDGFGAPPPRARTRPGAGGMKLREPTLNAKEHAPKGGVLFRRDATSEGSSPSVTP